MVSISGGGNSSDALARKQGDAATRHLTMSRHDDFTVRPNGLFSSGTVLPTGQAWTIGMAPPAVASDLQIVSGVLRLLQSGASYIRCPGPTPPDSVTVEFVLFPGTTFGSTIALIVSQMPVTNTATGPTGIATNSIHWVIGATSIQLSIYEGATNNTPILTLNYPALVADGKTRYRASIRRVGTDRLLVSPPGPTPPVSVRDSRISRYWGATMLIEHYQPALTDQLFGFTGFGVGSIERRSLPSDLPAGIVGMPGTIPTSGPVVFSLPVGTTRYTPFEVREPITINSALLEVTTAAGIGETCRAGVYAVNDTMQPTALMTDFGTTPIDAMAVKSWVPNVTLQPDRYLLGWKASATASYRCIPYGLPGLGVRSNLAGLVNVLSFLEAYDAFVSPGTPWTASPASAAVGWICPVVLGWVSA